MTARLAGLLLLSAGLIACSAAAGPDRDRPPRRDRPPLPTQEIRERVQVTLPDGFRVSAELADQQREIRIGLMGRDEVPPGEGMLFVFATATHRSFWMKNCLVPLDMIWLAETPGGGRVVHLEHAVPPCEKDPCPSYTPTRAARFVLELGAGEASRHGVSLGRPVEFRLPSRKGPAGP